MPNRTPMRARSMAGALLAFVLLAAPLLAADPVLHDPAWRAGHDLDSLGSVIAFLDDRDAALSAIAGLDAAATRAVYDEVALHRLYEQVLVTGRPADGAAAIERFLATGPDGTLAVTAEHVLAILEHLSGQAADARQRWEQLGFLHDFQWIGPFQNERGSGFSAGYPPEDEVDVSAEYPGIRGPVTWSQWSAPGIAGQIEIGERMRPNEEALAYLVTWIDAPEATDAVLRIGSTGAYRVWLGETEVAALDVERPIHLDQDAIPVRLHSGVQRLRILTGQTKGPWRFRVRISDDAGDPLPGLTVSAEPQDTTTPEGFDPLRTDAVARGALGLLERSEPIARARALSAYLTMRVHAHDERDHPDRTLVSAALEASPDDPTLHWMLATSYEEAVGHEAEREENPRREALERALALDPSFDRARFALVEYALDRFGNTERAGDWLLPALEREDPSPLALELARRIDMADLGLAAAMRWDAPLEEGLDEEIRTPVRLRAARRLLTAGDPTGAIGLIDAGLARVPVDEQLSNARASLASELGDTETARAIVERRVDTQPMSVDVWAGLSRFERAHGNLEGALDAIDRALLIAPEDERLLDERGQLLHQLGRDAAALASWERALEIEPNQPRLRSLTEYLATREPGLDDEFRIDVAERIAAALATPVTEEDPYRILLEQRVSDVQEDGTATRYHQRVMQVLTDAGVRQLDVHMVPYAHGEQWVRVVRARVHHPDGSYADARIRNRAPEVREGEYPVWSRAFVDLPPLRVGDVVEIEYLLEDLRQSFFGGYFGEEVLFGGFLPRDETIYTVRFPSGKLHHRTYALGEPELSEANGRTTWRWHSTESNKVEPEPAGPPVAELVPRIEVSTYEDWDEFATWYHHLIRKQFEASPEIRAKVEELTAGAEDPREIVRRIYEFVANDIRYIAWEFGVHGFQPYNAATIFTRRFGDCKDKATLICTMLDTVDIEAWPVLINGTMQRPDEDITLPLVSHFNHCIAYVPSIDGGLFIDGTAENHGVRELPSMDRGAEIVVIRDDGAERHTIPWNSPEELAIREESVVEIDSEGTAEIDRKSVLTGDYAVMMRDQFEVVSKRTELIERILGGRYPGLEVKKVETSDLDDLSEPVTLELELTVPRYVELGGAEVELPPVRDLLRSLEGVGNSSSRAERAEDLLIGNPRGGDLRIDITFPEGYRVASVPEPLQLSDDAIRFEYEVTVEGRTISVRRSYRMLHPRVAPEVYESFKDIVDRIERKLEERITLAPGKEVD